MTVFSVDPCLVAGVATYNDRNCKVWLTCVYVYYYINNCDVWYKWIFAWNRMATFWTLAYVTMLQCVRNSHSTDVFVLFLLTVTFSFAAEAKQQLLVLQEERQGHLQAAVQRHHASLSPGIGTRICGFMWFHKLEGLRFDQENRDN